MHMVLGCTPSVLDEVGYEQLRNLELLLVGLYGESNLEVVLRT